MRRREMLISAGLVGTSGCLRLEQGDEQTTQVTPDTGADTSRPSPGDVTLSERWRADTGIDFVWTDRNRFFFNDWNGAAAAVPGDGVLWSNEVEYEGSSSNLGVDAFAEGRDTVVFGYYSEPERVETPGAHFRAYDWGTGDEQWSVTKPAENEAEGINWARGAVVVDDIVAVVTYDWVPPNPGTSYVYGIDIETGEQQWVQTDQLPSHAHSIKGVGAHDGEVYVGTSSGMYVLNPSSGAVVNQRDSWSGPFRIHGETLFIDTGSRLQSYSLADDNEQWLTPEFSGMTNTLTVDNSLAVVGTNEGGIHAFDRETGEQAWEATIDTRVNEVVTSGQHVWVADEQTGLTAYYRADGTTVHRSTKPLDGAGIGVVDDTILLGGERARAYEITIE